MKKLKGIFIIIFVFLLSILNLNSKAYSTNDFYIDIPDYYEKIENNSFAYMNFNSIQGIMLDEDFIENGNKEYYKVNKKNLELIVDSLNHGKFMENGYQISFSVIDSKIAKFGEGNYKGFYIRTKINTDIISVYADYYAIPTDNKLCSLIIYSDSIDYLETTEVEDIVSSWKIHRYNYYTVEKILPIIAIFVIIILAVIFILSKRKKNINSIDNYKGDKKQELNSLDFDEYNVGYSGNIENVTNTNSNELKTPTTNDREQKDKKINTKKEYLLPMRWYNFYGFIKLPIEIAILISSLCMYCSILFEYNFFVGIFIVFISIIQLIYMIYLINIMSSKKKNGLNYITGWLCIETLMISLITTLDRNDFNVLILLMSICLYTLIWFLPNYTYFKKREYIFETEGK